MRTYYDDLFDKAQQIVRWHYQWIIVHEFLPLVCGQDSVDRVNRDGLQFYAPDGNPFIPVEFADPLPPPDQRTDLRGGPVAPEFAVDSTHFFTIDGDRIPQRAKRIEAKLNVRLLDLPPITDVPVEIARQLRSLAVRNLLRSEAQELHSAQDIARKIGEVPLSDAELGTTGPIYLWYYILKEADLRHNGGRLGPAGALIVTEVLLGLLDAGPASYRSTYPIWTPIRTDRYRRGYRQLPHQARRHPRADCHSPRSGRCGRHRRQLSGTCLTRRIRAPLPQFSDPVSLKGFGAGVAAVSSLRAVPPLSSTARVLLDISRYILSP